jgi:predicted hotdog family 3-hydroxylacyl-ACP dehydratase
MRDCPYAIADLLPHAAPMMLLDRVIGWDDGRLEASVAIRPDSRFFEPGMGVPGHVGIEYMAQSCGAYVGLEAKRTGKPVRIGFLLGTRQYVSKAAWFRVGETLIVSIAEALREGAMGVFDCRISRDSSDVATARLSVYQPDEPALPLRDVRPDMAS